MINEFYSDKYFIKRYCTARTLDEIGCHRTTLKTPDKDGNKVDRCRCLDSECNNHHALADITEQETTPRPEPITSGQDITSLTMVPGQTTPEEDPDDIFNLRCLSCSSPPGDVDVVNGSCWNPENVRSIRCMDSEYFYKAYKNHMHEYTPMCETTFHFSLKKRGTN